MSESPPLPFFSKSLFRSLAVKTKLNPEERTLLVRIEDPRMSWSTLGAFVSRTRTVP